MIPAPSLPCLRPHRSACTLFSAIWKWPVVPSAASACASRCPGSRQEADTSYILLLPSCQDSHSGNFSKRLWRSCYTNWADNRWTLNLSKTYPKTGIVERSCNPRTPERDAGGCCKAQGQPGRGLPWLSKWTKQMICTVTHHPQIKGSNFKNFTRWRQTERNHIETGCEGCTQA